MSEIKINQVINNVAETAGLLAMTAAAAMITLEGAHRPDQKAVLPMEPAMAPIGDHSGGHDPMSRERNNETAPHHVSYSETQRTPSRSGR
ncbi:MAG TPA: hypothetical protein VM535_00060 [Candidatus Saccharimonadales bacterium]|nr:hypothetical protein [Candidatus Saccharimonadales bacterium]